MNEEEIKVLLQGLLSPVGSGAFLWGFVAFIIKLFPALNQKPEAKFWLSMGLAFGIPPTAYGILIAAGLAQYSLWSLLAYIGVGYMVSSGVHRGSTTAVNAAVETRVERAIEAGGLTVSKEAVAAVEVTVPKESDEPDSSLHLPPPAVVFDDERPVEFKKEKHNGQQ